jgi:NADH-quinone oxidoreductase subunit C
MADEPKAPPSGGPGEPPAKPSEATGGAASPPEPSAEAKAPEAAKPPAPAKPATPAAKPPAPPAKAPVKPDPWTSPLLDELQKRFPGAITDPLIFRNQPAIIVAKESLLEMGAFLKSDEGGGYTLLTDETAVDYPKREKRFEVVYHLYSFQRNDRLRIKVLAGEGEKVPSVVGLWPTADWMEREVYDMFGVLYEGHPNLKRILLPDEWVGYPLRKDYDILRQDDAWVQANLNIKSGQ